MTRPNPNARYRKPHMPAWSAADDAALIAAWAADPNGCRAFDERVGAQLGRTATAVNVRRQSLRLVAPVLPPEPDDDWEDAARAATIKLGQRIERLMMKGATA